MGKFIKKIFDTEKLNSKITSPNTQKKELWLGYFLGPCFVYMAYYAIAGSYLTQFYTDVLGMSGFVLALMPVVSKIIDAITNIIMGRIIDKTRTKQGKARPWVLISGVFMAVCGVLLYLVPTWNNKVQIVWVVVSYNLFFAFAFTIYNMSHALMVPLSTRDTKQRDSLAMMTSMGTAMIPGLLVTIILPALINAIGVGSEAQSRWILIMGMLSVMAIPATFVEYYFTKERVTEEGYCENEGENRNMVSFARQFKACFSDKYWVMIMVFWGIYQILNSLSTNSMLYYCNWVLGNSVQSGTGKQVLVNAIGQAPLGLGIIILWPLVRKFGKRWVTQIGFVIAAIGCFIVMLSGQNMSGVLTGLVIKSIGALPTYAMAAQMAEALDHIEWKNGFRADGFSVSINSILITVMAGLGQTIILGGIHMYGYIVPGSNVETIVQPDAMRRFFTWGFVGIPMIGYLIGALIMTFYDIEKKMPRISADILQRHKTEAGER